MDIICPTDYDVISNMPIESVEQDTAFSLLEEPQRDEKEGGDVNFRPTKTKKRTTFQTTPPISSYLVCFVMGKFDFIEETIRLEYTAYANPPFSLYLFSYPTRFGGFKILRCFPIPSIFNALIHIL